MNTLRFALAASLLLLVAACAHDRPPMPCGCLPPAADAPQQG